MREFQLAFELIHENHLVEFQDEDAFFKDYAESHKKLSELGLTRSSSLKMTKATIGVLVTLTVIILSYLYDLNKQA